MAKIVELKRIYRNGCVRLSTNPRGIQKLWRLAFKKLSSLVPSKSCQPIQTDAKLGKQLLKTRSIQMPREIKKKSTFCYEAVSWLELHFQFSSEPVPFPISKM